MKSLKEHILEAFKEFKITEKWMQDAYDLFNAEYFDNELPDKHNVDLSITSKGSKTIGQQGFKKPMWVNRTRMSHQNGYDKYIMLVKDRSGELRQVKDIVIELEPFIILNPNFRGTEDHWEDTLLHEMIHLWTYKDGLAPKQAHGPEFRKKCDQIRKIAKEKYGKDYELEIYTRNKQSYELRDEEKQKIIKRAQRKASTTSGLYFTLSTTWYPKRFMFVSNKNLPDMYKYITKYEKQLTSIYVTNDSYEKMCKEYGKFSVGRTYRFFDVNQYPKSTEYMMKGDNLINSNEAKKEYTKPIMNVIEIDPTIDLSHIDLEDMLNEIEKIKTSEDVEIKGDKEIEKTLIDGTKGNS